MELELQPQTPASATILVDCPLLKTPSPNDSPVIACRCDPSHDSFQVAILPSLVQVSREAPTRPRPVDKSYVHLKMISSHYCYGWCSVVCSCRSWRPSKGPWIVKVLAPT